jgi:hypothetical protein
MSWVGHPPTPRKTHSRFPNSFPKSGGSGFWVGTCGDFCLCGIMFELMGYRGGLMTEEEWLRHRGDPSDLLIFESHRNNHRKLRLFACACVAHIHIPMAAELFQQAIRVAVRVADSVADESERIAALNAINVELEMLNPFSTSAHAVVALRYTLSTSAIFSFASANRAACSRGQEKSAEQIWQSSAFRDIFGNPFRPVVADPAWLTSTVVAIATSLYQDRAFDRLPILADALEEAGCTNADLLLHCRQPGDHVRGCWAVDLVLGKE